MTAYEELLSFQRETEALGEIAHRLNWDQETMMPRGAADQRAEEIATLESLLHTRRTDPRVGEWLRVVDEADLDNVGRAQLRLIRETYQRCTKVPVDLARQMAATTSKAQGLWAEARANDDMAAFVPVLAEVVRLKRHEGAALSDGTHLTGRDPYDAMLNDYEPGTTATELSALFAKMRPRLTALRDQIRDKPDAPRLNRKFAPALQLGLSEKLAHVFGYDMRRGRIDQAVHPFSSGSGDDVRVTTRTDAHDPFGCVYSTIHEVGHGSYEQGIDAAYRMTPIGHGVSMGVHESQSRIYENQLGRGRDFTAWLYQQMQQVFGDLGIDDEQAFYAAVNRVDDGFIRTEADEVQYNLHIMMRFDLERALVSGDLAATDLEGAWNERFLRDFGFAVNKPSNGCLQDVHWAVGLFGYFPTYSLGNVYAGCLYQAMGDSLPTLPAMLRLGDTRLATEWLRENLHQHGGLRTPKGTIIHASGMEPSPEPLLAYLEQKFAEIYAL